MRDFAAEQRPKPFLLSSAVALYRSRRNLHRPADVVVEDQLRRLRLMVRHAQRTIPVYRDLYPDGVAKEVRGWDDLRHLPILEKPFVHSRPESDRRSGPSPDGVRVTHSSGTTGEPRRIEYSPAAAWWHGVLALRMVAARGIYPWDRVAAVTLGHVPSAPTGVASWLRRSRALPVDATEEELVAHLVKFKPALLSGSGRVLIEVGERLQGRLRIRVVATFGETVPPEHRAALRELYGSEPIDTYGTAEHGHVAWQCREADLYHINHEADIVEILDENDEPVPAGQRGQVVLTGLWNPLMPFLRYRIGDTGVLADRPCACGSTLPALQHVDGRTMDWLVDDQGFRVAPQRLWLSQHVSSEEFSAIARYRIRQDETGATTIEISPRESPVPTPDRLDEIRQSYQRVLGVASDVHVCLRERLDPDASGKFRIIASACQPTRGLLTAEALS